ncbi:hypothetical protein BRC71_07535 [Halobacteriales archaeon QH_7_65_31]|nr:MAG: hypothetical protein BRC71_07535 [Halobacteriales archaeon QH_7_65_31]
MSRKLSRRSLLYGGAVAGSGLLAGCGGRSEGGEPSSSPTATETSAPGSITLTDLSVKRSELLAGETLEVTARVENTGGSPVESEVQLRVDERVMATRSLTLGAGERQRLSFAERVTTTGTQTVAVADTRAGDVVVRAERPESRRDVGAHYYPWYGSPMHNWDGAWSTEAPSTPMLGNYNSTEPDVIEQHIDWCRQAGITWLNVSWWGRYEGHDERLREDILTHPRAEELDWSILYETVGQFGPNVADLSAEPVREQFVDDIAYLAENYFSRESYKQIDGRPVLYLWAADNFTGDVTGAYEAAVERAGVRPYLVVSIPAFDALDANPIVDVADAVTAYNVYDTSDPSGRTADEFVADAETVYDAWYRASAYADVNVIPTAMPGFDDTELTHVPRDNVPLESTPAQYERVSELARRYADGPVLITSFNEWYEDTQIEPSEQHGEAYLDVTAETLAAADRTPPAVDTEAFTLSFGDIVHVSELEPVEYGRTFTFMLERLRVRDNTGETVVDLDAGTGSDAVTFLLGAYGPEDSETKTWRWLGGQRETVIAVSSLPEHGEVELTGFAPTEMELTLGIDGTIHDRTTLTETDDSYTLSF